jgi:hypothetical protein
VLFLNHPAILELIALVRWLFNPSQFRFLSTLLLRRKSKFFPLCDKLKDNEVVYSFEKVISNFRPFASVEVCVGHSFWSYLDTPQRWVVVAAGVGPYIVCTHQMDCVVRLAYTSTKVGFRLLT